MKTIQINSTNYNGQTADITFSPATGGTEVINGVTIPYVYTSNFVYGDYSVYFTSYDKTCPLNVAVPNPTISPTGINQYINVVLSGDSILDGGTYIWTLSNFNDVSGNTVSSYTGQTLQEGYFTTTGSSNVSLSVVQGTATATTTNFDVSGSTVMFLASAINSTNYQRSYDTVNWTGGTLPGDGNNEWASMATNGDIVVAANREPNDTEQFAYTYDGVSWTGVTWSGSPTDTNFRMNRLIYSEFLGKFVSTATDNFAGSFILQSSDGINFGRYTTPSSDVCMVLSDETNGLLLIQDEQSRGVYSSPDGSTWTLRNTVGNRIFASVYNKTFGRSIMLEEFTHQVVVSDDGVNYSGTTTIPLINSSQPASMAYRRSDGRTIVCSYQTNSAYYSDDGGVSWTSFTFPVANCIGLTYAEITGEWALVDRDGDIFTSTTGISGWTAQTKANTADYRWIAEYVFKN